MNKKIQNILFASDLSVDIKPVFEQAVTMATYTGANLIVLHVMEEASPSAQRQVKMAFGENLYKEIRAKHKTGAQDLLIGKNVDAVKIRQAIAGFFEDREKTPADAESPIKKILVAESHSIADEIVSTAVEEDCAFIVMGCRQQGLVAKAMGDKLVRKVLKRSSVPVFVVPRDRE
ncbi:MAG: universal stress protein [Desulfotignum sp.]|nr:universal stress protein [Desulfotignum sp.]